MARGFTVLEAIIVIGLLATVAALGLFGTLDLYRSSSVRDEQELLVSLLERARSHALANMYASAHGVCTEGERYVVYREPFIVEEEAPRNTSIQKNLGECGEGILFAARTAMTASSDITLSQGMDEAGITINREGMIQWYH